MRTSVTELPESRVRIEAAVASAEVDKRMGRAAGELAADLRLPGFRKGKVPPELVIQRIGREAVVEQALRSSLPEWYDQALREAHVTPVGEPSLDVAELPAPGEELTFSIEVGVRPKAELGDYKGLEVGRAEPEVPGEAIQAELDRLREGFASLNPVERPATEGDLVSLDYRGTIDDEPFAGGEGHDQLVELGSGTLVEGFEEELVGAGAGDRRTIAVTFPDEYRVAELAGRPARFEVTVKEVREKELPELDDEFASEASEFETLEELRAAIGERIAATLAQRAEEEYRSAAVDAAVDAARVELPEEIVQARAEESLERFLHSLTHRGVDPEAFLKVQEGGREGMLADVTPEARRSLEREATLEAIADAEGIEASDDELLAALGPGEGDQDPRKLLERLRRSGRDELLRDEVRMRKAAELVVEAAKPIPVAQAAAREAIWTPDKEAGEPQGEASPQPAPPAPGKLWTPGS